MTPAAGLPAGPSLVAGPAEVVAARRTGGWTQLTVAAPQLAGRARPGQFVMAAASDQPLADLRRVPLWVAGVEPATEYGATVRLAVDGTRERTRWLAARAPGDGIELLGPLGRRAPLPAEPVTCAVLASGTGQVPVAWLATVLRERGCQVHVVLAEPGPADAYAPLEARRASDRLHVLGAADSGPQHLSQAAGLVPGDTALVYAVGDAATCRAGRDVAGRLGAQAVALLERSQPCGTGLCHGCRVPAAGGGSLRSCLDGPALPMSDVDWDRVVQG